MPLVQVEQRTEEWLEARKGKITASLAAACLGLDPYTGPLSAWNQITGRTAKKASNYYMEWGNQHEAHARAQYEIETGNVAMLTGFWVHPTLPWLGASPDSLVGDDGLLECKCPAEPVTEIPKHHEIQMRIQMTCTGRDWCDYFSWTQKGAFLGRVERNDSEEVHLLNALEAWYRQYILPDVAPPRRRPKPGCKEESGNDCRVDPEGP